MTARRIGTSFILASSLLFIPSVVSAQLQNTLHTVGAKAKANEAQVCAPDYVASIKPIEGWQRSRALAKYGKRDDYAGPIDHLIPLELGGSNEPENLWPQPDQKEYGFAAKNELEAKLREMVCTSKTLSLKDAQDAIKKNWVKAYDKYVKGQ
jgi:hypothetical protein